MYEGGVERDVAEQVEQVVIVHGTIGADLSRLGSAGQHQVVGKGTVARIHATVVVLPVNDEMSDTRVELMLVHGDIEVAPADTDTVGNAPHVGTFVHDIGHAEPSPIHIAHTRVGGGNGCFKFTLGELMCLRGHLRVQGLVEVSTSGNGQACGSHHSGNDDFVIYCFHCQFCFNFEL